MRHKSKKELNREILEIIEVNDLRHDYSNSFLVNTDRELKDLYYYVYTIQGKDYLAYTYLPGTYDEAYPIAFESELTAIITYIKKLTDIQQLDNGSEQVLLHLSFFENVQPKMIIANQKILVPLIKTTQTQLPPFRLFEEIDHWIIEIMPGYKDLVIRDLAADAVKILLAKN